MSDQHANLSPNVLTTVKIIRLFIRTPYEGRFAKMEKAATEGHGPALFNAINEIGMLAPIVELATGGEKTGSEAHSIAQQIIACAGNCGLFLRDEDGAVKYPNFRPVPGYGEFLVAAAPKSVLDEDDDDADGFMARFSLGAVPVLFDGGADGVAGGVPGSSSAVAELDNRPQTGDNRASDGGAGSGLCGESVSPLSLPDDLTTLDPFANPGAFILPDVSQTPGYVPFPSTE